MDNVYDYDKNILRINTKEGISFNLKLRSPIMQVTGASGVGRTLLVNKILNLQLQNKRNSHIVEDCSNIVVYRAGVDLKEYNRCLFIIDDAEFYLSDKVCEQIVENRFSNKFLVFGRQGFPLGLSPNYYGRFVNKDKCVTIEYDFSEVGWF